MKNLIYILCLCFSVSVFSQQVEVKNTPYNVKNGKIFKDGVEVTTTLSEEDKAQILEKAAAKQAEMKEKMAVEKQLEKEKKEAEKAQKKAEKELKQLEKEKKQAEKEKKRAEKERKKAEKEKELLEKRKEALEKAENNLKKEQLKYDRLKRQGKLSPVDETKWDEKIQKLTDRVNKAKRNL